MEGPRVAIVRRARGSYGGIDFVPRIWDTNGGTGSKPAPRRSIPLDVKLLETVDDQRRDVAELLLRNEPKAGEARPRSESRTTRALSWARGAPTQKWVPCPKPRCGLSPLRCRSNSSGSAKWAGSWLAAPNANQDSIARRGPLNRPARCPPSPSGRARARSASKRRVSSITAGISDRSATTACQRAGSWEKKEERVGDQIGSRLVASNHHVHHLGDELVLREGRFSAARQQLTGQDRRLARLACDRSAPGRSAGTRPCRWATSTWRSGDMTVDINSMKALAPSLQIRDVLVVDVAQAGDHMEGDRIGEVTRAPRLARAARWRRSGRR